VLLDDRPDRTAGARTSVCRGRRGEDAPEQDRRGGRGARHGGGADEASAGARQIVIVNGAAPARGRHPGWRPTTGSPETALRALHAPLSCPGAVPHTRHMDAWIWLALAVLTALVCLALWARRRRDPASREQRRAAREQETLNLARRMWMSGGE
jgi:hypothetical protein